MRLYGFVGLLLVLSACTKSPPSVADVSGIWRDEAAAFTTCGETFPVGIALDLEQTASTLQGTFTLQETVFPFAEEVAATRITGDVRSGEEEVLTAALTLQQNHLIGTFTAIEAIPCTTGGTSVTVYKVNLKR